MSSVKETLCRLSEINAVSGNEKSICETLAEMLKEYSESVYIKNNCVFADFGAEKGEKPHVLIDAHLDQIGMIVKYIEKDGFLRVGNVGGLDRRLLPAQQVTIHGKKDIKGVIASIPPHLSSDSKVLEMDEVLIDTGYSKKELEEIVSLGDVVSFDVKAVQLTETRVTGKSLDDRAGITAIFRMLDRLRGEKLPCRLTVMFSSQEETNESGATTGAFLINPDVAIAVDVSFAMSEGEDPKKCGVMGKGAMIGFAPVLDRDTSLEFKKLAETRNIPYQIEVMGRSTGTNADRFSINRCGAKACTISIPLKYMHTPVEIIDVNDIENTAELLAAYVLEGEKNIDIPYYS